MDLLEYTKYRDNIKYITNYLNISYLNLLRYDSMENEIEPEVRSNFGFFQFYYSQSWFIVCIELCKLFTNSRNQKFNYFKLQRKLLRDDHQHDFMELLDANRIGNENAVMGYGNCIKTNEELKDTIASIVGDIENQSDIMSQVKDLRDQLYAHFDGDFKDDLPVSVKDISPIVDLSEKVYNTLFGRIDRVETSFKNPFLANIGEIINGMVERNQFIDLYHDLWAVVEDESVNRKSLMEMLNNYNVPKDTQ